MSCSQELGGSQNLFSSFVWRDRAQLTMPAAQAKSSQTPASGIRVYWDYLEGFRGISIVRGMAALTPVFFVFV